MFAAIALEPPVEVVARFASFRACYDPNFSPDAANGWAHITVRRPATLLRPLDELVTRFAVLATSLTEPIRVEAGGVSVYHSPGLSAIFLRIVPSPALEELYQHFRVGLADFFEEQAVFKGLRYLPHLTLANGLDDRQLAAALRDLELGRPELLGLQHQWFSCSVLTLGSCDNASQIGWQHLMSVQMDGVLVEAHK
jgi:2'-5' RNA ligase